MSASENISVTSISIKNAFGIREAQITPGRVTLVSGQNGKGKTSVIRSIENATDGGSIPGLLNHDSDSGEVILVLSDDTEIRKRFSKKSTSLQITRNGKKIASPQGFLNELTSSMGCNPLKLLTASKTQRHKIFMDSLPVVVDADELSALVGEPVNVDGRHGIEVIDDLYQSFYQKRRSANREALRVQKSIESCQKVIDGYDPNDIADLETEIDVLRDAKSQIQLKLQQECSDVMSAANEKIHSLQSQKSLAEAKISSIDERYENKKLKIEKVLNEKIAGLRKSAQDELDAIEVARLDEVAEDREMVLRCSEHNIRMIQSEAESKCQQHKIDRGERLSEIESQLSRLESDHKAASRVEPILEEIISFKDELADVNSQVDQIQSVMDEIISHKSKLLSDLNLEWFDYKDKQIYIDGVEFEVVNTARLIQVAIELARLQSPRLRLLCVDGLESLDSNNMRLLVKEAERSDMNLIVTKVDDTEGVQITPLDGDMNRVGDVGSNYAH